MATSLVISAGLILAFGSLRGWAAWWTRRQYRLRMCEVAHYSHWMCPQCSTTYGNDVVFTHYANTRDVLRSANQPATIVVCPHCRNVTLFDANGLPADEVLQFHRRDELLTSEDTLWSTPLGEEHFAELLADQRLTYQRQI